MAKGTRRVAAKRCETRTEIPRRFFAVQSVVLTARARVVEKAVRYFFPPPKSIIGGRISCGEKASLPIRLIEQLIDKSHRTDPRISTADFNGGITGTGDELAKKRRGFNTVAFYI